MSLKRSDSGFTLIEVMIALGILSVLILGVASMQNLASKSQQNIQNHVDFLILQNSIQTILGSSNLCANAFKDAAGNTLAFAPPNPTQPYSQPIQSVYMSTSSPPPAGVAPMATLGGTLGGGLTVSDLRFDMPGGASLPQVQMLNPATGALVTYNQFIAKLVLQVTKSTGALGGRTLDNLSNPAVVTLLTNPATGVVASCFMQQLTQGICAQLGGTWNAAAVPPKCSLSQSFLVPLATLANYHNLIKPSCAALSGNDLLGLMAACNRYCDGACAAGGTNCNGPQPGKGFASGTVTECDGTTNQAACGCSN